MANRVRIQRKPQTGNVNVSNIFKVTADDIKAELENLQKSRIKLDKNNEKLELEVEKANDIEEKWEDELESLYKKSKNSVIELEERLQKEEFDWKQERKALELESEQLAVKVEEMENEVDERGASNDRDQEREISLLREEIAKILKGADSKKDTAIKLEAQKRIEHQDREEAENETKNLKKEIQSIEDEYQRLKPETKKLQQKLDELRRTEKTLIKQDDDLDEAKSEVERSQLKIKKLEKDLESVKEEKKVLNDLKIELEDWQSQGDKLETDIEKLKKELNITKDNVESAKRAGSREDRLGSGRTGRKNEEDQTLTLAQRAAQREIEELEDKLRITERSYMQRKGDLEEKVTTANMEQKKLESKSARLTDEILEMKNELAKIRDHAQVDEKEIEDKTMQIESDFTTLQRDLEKVRKELAKTYLDIEDSRNKVRDTKISLSATLDAIAKQVAISSQYEIVEQTFTKERRIIADSLNDVNEEIKLTQNKLETTKSNLSNIEKEYEQYTKSQDELVASLEAELYGETRKTEELRRNRWKLEQESTQLNNYFRPLDEVKKAETEVDPAAEEKWYDIVRDQRLSEVKKMRDRLNSVRPKERSLQELNEAFTQGLELLDPIDKEDMSIELNDLNKIMLSMNMSTKDRFNMFVIFVEEFIDPGIIREIGNLLKLQISPVGVHPLRSASHLLWLSQRDVKMDPSLNLRDVLLERLAFERHQRSHKDIETCKTIILQGGDEEEKKSEK